MSDLTLELDPVAVRKSLQASRERGESWESAWAAATSNAVASANDPYGESLVRFMEKHFRAAYYDTAAPEGRCMVPERDVSHAVPTRQDEQIRALYAGGKLQREIADMFGITQSMVSGIVNGHSMPVGRGVRRDGERCRSGDGCDHPAVRGRHGTYWCEHHASELEHLTTKLRLNIDKANPRRTQFMRRGMERAA